MSKVIRAKLPCPVCTSSDAYHEYDDGHGYCFSCEYFKPKEDQLNDFTYEFLPLRGCNRDTFKLYGVRSKVASDGRPSVVGFPYPSGSVKCRRLDTKSFYWEGEHRPGLFGTDKFGSGSHKYVIITEGELDACSYYQVLRDYVGCPVVSVQSASSATADVAADLVWLAGFERVYLAFDGDAAGRSATTSVARLFDYNKVFCIKFTQPDRKDANDYLARGEGDVLVQLFNNARRYLPEQIISDLDDFKAILSEEHSQGVPYPIQSLNELTFGIRQGESVLITAQEGVGKTELMHAIEYQLLTRTQDNVGAIYLEEPKRRHLEALAGIALKSPVHLPDSGWTSDQVYEALRRVVGSSERLHLYSHFGSDDPIVLLDTIRFLVTARACRYILLDHISMVVSGLAGDDERRALDFLSTRLEMMVKELNFALIMVSHVNDDGKTRGSRLIAKVADIRIDLDRDVLSNSRTTTAVVSKNRFSGRTGFGGSYQYDPLTGLIYQEQGFKDATDKVADLPTTQSQEVQDTTTKDQTAKGYSSLQDSRKVSQDVQVAATEVVAVNDNRRQSNAKVA